MSLTITRKSLQGAMIQGQHTWPLELTAVSTEGSMPAEIFVYHRGQDGQAAYAGDTFENVASVHDMAEYGLQPTLLESGKIVPFFRTNHLIFHCRTPVEADELYIDIMEDVRDLIRNTEALTHMTTELVETL